MFGAPGPILASGQLDVVGPVAVGTVGGVYYYYLKKIDLGHLCNQMAQIKIKFFKKNIYITDLDRLIIG